MKKLAILSLSMLGMIAATGCSTPGYTARERGQQISRNQGLEWQMLQDDVDDVFMLRPLTGLTRWNIR